MNKTVTINIAGLVFHIDEDAYNKLDSYINAVRNSIQQEDSKDEIIADIEGRIAELFAERIDPQSGVIRMNNVDEIINIMGKPEDYIIEEETNNAQHFSGTVRQPKKVYRDGEKRILGGVCSGLGHYLNVDAVWIRIVFILLFFLYGTSLLAYFILWIIIPKARTVADVLEMKGEPVNISNIEKQFRQGLTNSYQTIKTNGKTAGDIIRKIIGISLIIFGAFGTFGSFFTPIVFSSQRLYLFNLDSTVNYLSESWVLPFWLINLCLFLVSCLPFILIILLGLKISNPKTRHIGLISAILGFLWLVALFVFSYTMINSDMNYSKFRKTIRESYDPNISKADLILGEKDTLNLIFDRDPRIFTINDTITNDYRYSEIDDVEVEILESNIRKPYVEIEEKTFKKMTVKVKGNVKLIKKDDIAFNKVSYSNTLNYNYSIKSDTLALSNAILATRNKYTEENEVRVKVFITPNQTIKINGRDEDYIRNIDLDSGANYYRFNNKGKLKNTNDTIN